MGGLTKELLECVGAALFDPERGLFTAAAAGALCPHPLAAAQPSGAALLALAGTLMGKALYEGVLLAAPLAPFFVGRLQGRLPTLDDLAALDPEVHRSLVALKRLPPADVADLGLDFTAESDEFGARRSEELIPSGASVAVTAANRPLFVVLVADWHLRRRLGPAAAAFRRGLAAVLPPAWLRLFSPGEVNQLLGGGEGAGVDVADMRRHAHYGGGYSPASRTVKLFWREVERLHPADRAALLRFATACGRPPLGGFAHLKPPLTIYKVRPWAGSKTRPRRGGNSKAASRQVHALTWPTATPLLLPPYAQVDCGASPLALLGGPDVDRLPSASTCSNLLKLPNYRRGETLREKLLAAIRSGSGFDLS
jgi:hypothetical protein